MLQEKNDIKMCLLLFNALFVNLQNIADNIDQFSIIYRIINNLFRDWNYIPPEVLKRTSGIDNRHLMKRGFEQ